MTFADPLVIIAAKYFLTPDIRHMVFVYTSDDMREEFLMQINSNYLNLQDSYLFSTIAKKVNAFQAANPHAFSCSRLYTAPVGLLGEQI